MIYRFLRYWLPFLLYSVLILTVSSQSHVPGAQHVQDKVAHFTEYGIFAFLFWRALIHTNRTGPHWPKIITIILISAGFGAFDEFYQSFIPGRFSSVYDWFADVAGILGMITFLGVYQHLKEAPDVRTS